MKKDTVVKKKLLLLGSAASIYTKDYIDYVLFDRYQIGIANTDSSHVSVEYQDFYDSKGIKIYNIAGNATHHNKIIRKLNLYLGRLLAFFLAIGFYDVIHVHYVGSYSDLLCFLPSSKKLILSIYGSDLLRANKRRMNFMKRIYIRADKITVATDYLKQYFLQAYRNLKLEFKITEADLGDKNLDFASEINKQFTREQCKAECGVPIEKICVHIGYNGRSQQQHIEIIREMKKLPEKMKQQLYLIIPCGYSLTDHYCMQLEAELKNSDLEGKIDKTYYDGKALMIYRKTADYFINMQTTDVMSSSMIEYLSVGARMLQGGWLKYYELDNHIKVYKADRIADLKIEFVKMFEENYEYTKEEVEFASHYLLWDDRKEAWVKMMDNL